MSSPAEGTEQWGVERALSRPQVSQLCHELQPEVWEAAGFRPGFEAEWTEQGSRDMTFINDRLGIERDTVLVIFERGRGSSADPDHFRFIEVPADQLPPASHRYDAARYEQVAQWRVEASLNPASFVSGDRLHEVLLTHTPFTRLPLTHEAGDASECLWRVRSDLLGAGQSSHNKGDTLRTAVYHELAELLRHARKHPVTLPDAHTVMFSVPVDETERLVMQYREDHRGSLWRGGVVKEADLARRLTQADPTARQLDDLLTTPAVSAVQFHLELGRLMGTDNGRNFAGFKEEVFTKYL